MVVLHSASNRGRAPTLTFCKMQRATLALLPANVDKGCEFTACLKHLLAQPNVQKYMKTQRYSAGKPPINQAQCDHQTRWHNFPRAMFRKDPSIFSNHIAGKNIILFLPYMNLATFLPCRLCCYQVSTNTVQVQSFDFDDRSDRHDDFYVQLARVKYVAVLSFAKHVQHLLMKYAR